MNYNDALIETVKYHSLVGSAVNGDEISHLLIIPESGERVGDLVDRFLKNKTADDIYSNYQDFDVLVLYEIESFRVSGILVTERLSAVKRKLDIS